jgi:medium-chain acyl-[acyl-carrier-protein] hydrolase
MNTLTQPKTSIYKIVGKKQKTKFRMFCFPFAGGSASAFLNWRNFLPDYIEVIAVQLPGREDRIREVPDISIKQLLESLYEGFLDMEELPFVFFGHSMGAFLCLAFAKFLEENNAPLPQHVYISAAYPPEDSPNRKKLSHLSNHELVEEIKKLNGTPSAILNNKDFYKYYLPIIRRDFELLESLNFTDYINFRFKCPLTIMGGKQDSMVNPELLKQWKKYTISSSILKLFDGDHFFILSNPYYVLKEMARELRFLITEYYLV